MKGYPFGICQKAFDYWFTYITDNNQNSFYEPIRNMMLFRFNLIEELKACTNLKQYRHALKTFIKWTVYRKKKAVPLLKDPIAIFSSEWLAKTFDMNVLVMIRHPAAFASSLKRYNHIFPFSHFLYQPLLMKDHLNLYSEEIKEFSENKYDIIDQSALLWKCIYHAVIKYQNTRPNWFFLRHEDIARYPLKFFSELYDYCSLNFSETIQSIIKKYSDSKNPVEIPNGASHHHIKLNSSASIYNWKKRLSQSEIMRIKESVQNVSKYFYTDDDW